MRDRGIVVANSDGPALPARRTAFKAGLGIAVGLSVSNAAMARRLLPKGGSRELSLLNLHTGEKLRAEYWHNGRYVPDAMHAISVVLRDHRNNSIHPIDPRMLEIIHLMHGQLRSRAPFNVISGYRSPETNALMHEVSAGVAAHSLHMDGMAIDIRLPGVALGALKREAAALELGGVGYYPADDFVHVDCGPVRHWRG
jgi:uncharacterized protein YcbK (DUF882 family)